MVVGLNGANGEHVHRHAELEYLPAHDIAQIQNLSMVGKNVMEMMWKLYHVQSLIAQVVYGFIVYGTAPLGRFLAQCTHDCSLR